MKAIELKDWKNIFLNTNTLSKTFEFWVKYEKLDDPEFLKELLEELITWWFMYHQHLIWINSKFLLKEVEYMFNEVYQKFRKKIIWKEWELSYWKLFKYFVEWLDNIYDIVKENVLWIFEEIELTKWYFSYSYPKLFWFENNPNVKSIHAKNFHKYMSKIKNSRIENVFYNYKNSFNIKESLIEIYPSEMTIDWNRIVSLVSAENISDKKMNLIDEIVNKMYDYFLWSVINEFVDDTKQMIEKKNIDIYEEQEKLKDILLTTFFVYQKRIIDFAYKTYFDKVYLDIWNNLLYEDQIVSKVFDLLFVWKFWWWKFIWKVGLELLKSLLVKWMKEWYYDFFVLKINYYFKQKNYELNITSDWVIVKEWWKAIKVNLEKDELELMKVLWHFWTKKMRFWITIWLFWNSSSKINQFITDMINVFDEKLKMKVVTTTEYVDYENNNYLFAWASQPESLMHETLSLNVKEIFKITPYQDRNLDFEGMYFWVDYDSWFCLFKDPFKNSENKNIMIVWKTGSWKTFFSMQQMMTNFKDKFIILDPTWSFAMVKNIAWKSVSAIEIYSMQYNPIFIDYDMYKEHNIDITDVIDTNINYIIKYITFWKKISDDTHWLIYTIIRELYDNYNWKLKLSIVLDTLENIIKTKWKLSKYVLEKVFKTNRDLLLYEIDKKIFMELFKLTKQFEIIRNKEISKVFENDKDLISVFFKNNKIVFNIKKLTDKLKLKKDDPEVQVESRLIYWFLFDSILRYLSFNATIIKQYKDKLQAHPYHYLIIDEIWALIEKDEFMQSLFKVLVRTVRNMYASIVWLTQNTTDFVLWWKGKELELIWNFSIKLFFKIEDLISYISLKTVWNEDDWKNKWYLIKRLNYYLNKFQKANDEKDKNDKSKIFFLEYFWDFYLQKAKISKFFIKNYEKIKSW